MCEGPVRAQVRDMERDWCPGDRDNLRVRVDAPPSLLASLTVIPIITPEPTKQQGHTVACHSPNMAWPPSLSHSLSMSFQFGNEYGQWSTAPVQGQSQTPPSNSCPLAGTGLTGQRTHHPVPSSWSAIAEVPLKVPRGPITGPPPKGQLIYCPPSGGLDS